jgi:hypothetical protein
MNHLTELFLTTIPQFPLMITSATSNENKKRLRNLTKLTQAVSDKAKNQTHGHI